MHKNIFKKITKEFKEHYKLYIFYIILIFISFFKLNYYIYSPGSLVDLTDRIVVENSYNQKGSFNLTYVTTRHATILTYLLSYVIPNWDLESINDLRVENESIDEIFERGQIYLKETSYDAIIAAFNEAGLKYEISNINVTVTHVFDYAKTDLKVGDVIKSVNDKTINNVNDIKELLIDLNENDELIIQVIRKNKVINCRAKIVNKENEKIIGVALALLKDVNTTPKVDFVFSDSESGSSRGFMCALDIYNKITEYDLTKGDIISGTGTIDENGNAIAIDGVKYKLMGAVKENAKVFILPKENYDEAIKIKNENKYDIEIIGVETLKEAIQKLKER